MSSDNLQHGPHGEAGYEHQDLSSRAVFTFLIVLAVLTVIIIFMLRGAYSFMDTYQRNHQAPPSPLATELPKDTRMVPRDAREHFPEPRLEVDERHQLNDFIQDEEKQLNSYGYVNQQAGVVRIPIERAMQLIAQRGLPVRPQGGAVSMPAEKSGTDKPTTTKAAASH